MAAAAQCRQVWAAAATGGQSAAPDAGCAVSIKWGGGRQFVAQRQADRWAAMAAAASTGVHVAVFKKTRR